MKGGHIPSLSLWAWRCKGGEASARGLWGVDMPDITRLLWPLLIQRIVAQSMVYWAGQYTASSKSPFRDAQLGGSAQVHPWRQIGITYWQTTL